MGVFFFYVGIEVAVGANVNMYASELGRIVRLKRYPHGCLILGIAVIGTLLGSFIKQVPSEKQLVIASIGAIVLLRKLAMLTANPWILTLIGFFIPSCGRPFLHWQPTNWGNIPLRHPEC